MGVHLFLFYWMITGEIYEHAGLLGLAIPLPLLHGPLLYLYTRTLSREQGLPRHWWLHLLPTVFAYATMSRFFALTSSEKIAVYKAAGAGFEGISTLIFIATIFSGFTY